MKAAIKVDILKTIFLLSYFLLVLTAISAWAGVADKKGCGDSPFITNILNFEEGIQCYDVVLEVSFEDKVTYELSHVNFDFGCGTISNEWNSEGWKMESNHIDPTTGLGGLKVDDVSNFGKDSNFKSFQVKFTFCPSENCDDDGNHFNLDVGYKAGQCPYYETTSTQHCDNCNDDDGDDNDNDEPGDTTDDGTSDSLCETSGNDITQLTVEVSPTDPTCAEPSGGIIALDIRGGTTPYTVLWNNGGTSSTLSGLTAGTYSFTVSDANGNNSAGDVTLQNTAEIVIETLTTKPDCYGFNNGAIEVLPSGGTAPYTFVWNNGASTQQLTDLHAGTYSVMVTDANGCSTYQFIPLYNKTNIFLDASIEQPSCQLDIQGSISITPSGGLAPYSYLWASGETSNSIDGLTDGDYELTVTDKNGCSFTKTYIIESDIGIEVFATVTNVNCSNDPIGAIDLTISGGSEDYTVEWSNGENTEDLTGLAAGDYTAIITDGNGCQTVYNASVLKNNISIGYEGITIPSCKGSSDGAISINLTNGTTPYAIEWSNGSNNEDIDNLTAGTYTVKVTDALGCSSEKIFSLPEPEPVQISYNIDANECTGNQDIVVNASGGSLEFSYLWSDGSNSNELKSAAPGDYTITATDTRGCTATQAITLANIESQNLQCLINEPNDEVSCGSLDNLMTSTLDGVVSYSWEVYSSDGNWAITSATDQDQIAYDAGYAGSSATFTLSVTYESGCEVSCEKTLEISNTNPDDENANNSDDESTDLENPDDETDVDDVIAENDDLDGGTGGSEGEDGNYEDHADENEDECNCTSDDVHNTGDDVAENPNNNSGDTEEDFHNDRNCNPCEGGITYLNLAYLGDTPANVVVTGEIKGKKGSKGSKGKKEKETWEQAFTNVEKGEMLEIKTPDGAEKLGTWIYLSIDGGDPTGIHTSCSQDIKAGMTFDKYKVLAGASLKGGPLCEEIPPMDGDCNECEGGITYLDLAYLGEIPADIVVTGEIKGKKGSKGSKGKKEKETWEQAFTNVEKGEMLKIKTPDGAEKLGTWIYLSIDGGEPTGIHTSCSQDIKAGMTFDKYKVLAGASLKGGPLCEEIPSDDCNECFSTSEVNISKDNDGYHYSMAINHEDCHFDLSHLMIEIPSCYNIISYSNSMNWKMGEVHSDPATGLSGLKVDDIQSFGKDPNMPPFIIEFVLDTDNDKCIDHLDCFAPVIAYKSGTCVYEEITTGECYTEEEVRQFTVNTYPNPTRDFVKIDMKNADKSASYVADIYNFSGEKTHSYHIQKGFSGELLVDLRSKKQGLYFLKLRGSKGICTTHRIVKY